MWRVCGGRLMGGSRCLGKISWNCGDFQDDRYKERHAPKPDLGPGNGREFEVAGLASEVAMV